MKKVFAMVGEIFNILTLRLSPKQGLMMGLPKVSAIIGGLLALTGILGVVLASTDQVLASTAPLHLFALDIFILIDFVIALGFFYAMFFIPRTSKNAFTLAASWSLLRIILQIADVSQGPALGMSVGDFANYLFNPTLTTSPNPPGVPGALIDLILLLEIVMAYLAWSVLFRSI